VAVQTNGNLDLSNLAERLIKRLMMDPSRSVHYVAARR
jgi:hypothetical protein